MLEGGKEESAIELQEAIEFSGLFADAAFAQQHGHFACEQGIDRARPFFEGVRGGNRGVDRHGGACDRFRYRPHSASGDEIIRATRFTCFVPPVAVAARLFDLAAS